MENNDTLFYSHLHKLSFIKSEQDLDYVLTLLWKTRKAGLSASEKSSLQSLLSLPDLDPQEPGSFRTQVLACLRSLIRKFVRGNLDSTGILKLFPQNVSLEVQSMLIGLLQKHQSVWKEELSRDQDSLAKGKFFNHINAGLPPPPPISEPSLARQDYSVSQAKNSLGASSSLINETNMSHLSPSFLQSNTNPPENVGMLPRLKSMTWTKENQSAISTDDTAIISLKFQDEIRSPSGETEVNFRLSRDSLDAMLRSLAYIKEQLPTSSVASTEPLQKKQKQ